MGAAATEDVNPARSSSKVQQHGQQGCALGVLAAVQHRLLEWESSSSCQVLAVEPGRMGQEGKDKGEWWGVGGQAVIYL